MSRLRHGEWRLISRPARSDKSGFVRGDRPGFPPTRRVVEKLYKKDVMTLKHEPAKNSPGQDSQFELR
jgi:hypothetical protein